MTHEPAPDDVLAECMDACLRGDHGAVERACRDHPQLASAIRSAAGVAFELQAARGATEAAAPTRIDRFLLRRELGRGGMGVVYQAHDPLLERDIALKVLPLAFAQSPAVTARFHREARVLARIRHRNIVAIHEVGETADGQPYFAMDLVDGRTLAEILRDVAAVPAPSRRACHLLPGVGDADGAYATAVARMFADLAAALQHTHENGITHRDVKPGNILVDRRGVPYLVDFGIARDLEGATWTATIGTGTPAYMAPEQVGDRGSVGPWTDVYGLGIALYEALTLERPFDGASSAQVFRAILTREPRAPRRVDRSIPRDLEVVCLTAIEKDVHRRYSSARAFGDDLASVIAHRPIRARPASLLARAVKGVRRNPWPAATAGVVLLAALTLAGIAFARQWRHQRSWQDYETALQDLAGNRLDAGVAGLESALRWNPDHPGAALVLADVQAQQRSAAANEQMTQDVRAWLESHPAGTAEGTTEYEAILASVHGRFGANPCMTVEDSLVRLWNWRQLDLAALAPALASPRAGDTSGRFLIWGAPAGAAVHLFRFESGAGTPERLQPRPWHPDHAVAAAQAEALPCSDDNRVGALPRCELALPPGSYLGILRAAGCEDLRLPFVVRAGEALTEHAALLRAGTTPPGFVYVPAGVASLGGDPDATDFPDLVAARRAPRTQWVDGFWIGRVPITVAEYLEFLDDPATLAEVAQRRARGELVRVPRISRGDFGPYYLFEPLWAEVDGRFVTDWDLRWPVHQISCEDADAYCAWRTQAAARRHEDWTFRLPVEIEWERAARGADSRLFPWGNTFDWACCRPTASPATLRRPLPVGSLPLGESPFGVLDLEGGVLEWCSGIGRGSARTRPWRGASFEEPFEALYHAASVNSGLPRRVGTHDGFRLVAWRRASR